MRLCRYASQEEAGVGFYSEAGIAPLSDAALLCGLETPEVETVLDGLPGGRSARECRALWEAFTGQPAEATAGVFDAELKPLTPVEHPPKFLLLAGNYPKHVAEQGYLQAERGETFPYVFMKPPSTTMIPTGTPLRLPHVSPNAIDWEVELGVVIGQRCRHVSEAEALSVVAGYTVINDISDRKYAPNPERRTRERDAFFDWLHGKWHDGSAPIGPCVLSAEDVPDPAAFELSLWVDDVRHQHESAAQMVFPVGAIIEFITRTVTLEPNDVIATGTPSGVGKASGIFLREGQTVRARIEQIGEIITPIEAEPAPEC